MSEARRKRREFRRLVNKIQAKEKTQYKFEQVFKEIMEREVKAKENEISN